VRCVVGRDDLRWAQSVVAEGSRSDICLIVNDDSAGSNAVAAAPDPGFSHVIRIDVDEAMDTWTQQLAPPHPDRSITVMLLLDVLSGTFPCTTVGQFWIASGVPPRLVTVVSIPDDQLAARDFFTMLCERLVVPADCIDMVKLSYTPQTRIPLGSRLRVHHGDTTRILRPPLDYQGQVTNGAASSAAFAETPAEIEVESMAGRSGNGTRALPPHSTSASVGAILEVAGDETHKYVMSAGHCCCGEMGNNKPRGTCLFNTSSVLGPRLVDVQYVAHSEQADFNDTRLGRVKFRDDAGTADYGSLSDVHCGGLPPTHRPAL
jgi:hypothetical protein